MNRDKKHIVAPEDLMAFMDGQMDGERRKAVEEHLKTCLECRSLLESLELAEREVARAERVEVPEGYFTTFASRVANRIARKGLAPARRPWLLRWGWVPAAAAASFAVVMVLSHGFYDRTPMQEAALKRHVIPIPIAPEPRVPETAAVLETYYEEIPAVPAAEGISPEKDRLSASGSAQPAPATTAPSAAPEAAKVSSDEAAAVAGTRVTPAPGLVDMSSAPSAPPAAAAPDAKRKMASASERKSAAEPALEIAEKSQPLESAPELGDRDKARKDEERLAEDNRVARTATGLLSPKRRMVRIRQAGVSRVLLPCEPEKDTCPTSEVAAVEAVVIHLPNGGGETPPPEVEPAVRICLPQ